MATSNRFLILFTNIIMKFSEKCYLLLKKIPKGKVTTYAIIAHKLNTKAYRAVGNAMNKNTTKVPCHRVIKSNGEVGGFNKGVDKKTQLLKKEGVEIKNKKVINFKSILYKFD